MSRVGFEGLTDEQANTLMEIVLELAAARRKELCEVGFRTDLVFDIPTFMRITGDGGAVRLRSQGTATEYGVVLDPNTLTDEQVYATLVTIQGGRLKEENQRKLTLLKGVNGEIIVVPGWR